jgi:hypothetical protein
VRWDAVRFDKVVLADDRQAVQVDFIGGQEFDPRNPCSVAYEGTAEIVGDELEIGIYAQQHPKQLPPDTACELMGYARTLGLALDEPFIGSVVRDLAGQVLLLERPAGSVEFGGLPASSWKARQRPARASTSAAQGRTSDAAPERAVLRREHRPGHRAPRGFLRVVAARESVERDRTTS